MKKTKVPNVVRGGIAIPLGRNYYYMKGRSHEQGGIDIGKNPRTGLEVEGGEVVHVGNKEMRVFSAQPFITGGVSPAQRVMRGENPNIVFNAQEAYKRRNKLNDDGTKKKRMGGLSRDKDYGSKSKPYPKVKSKDFAGKNRSYPIPTKVDARDALRLAGLHGRSDVKAKVYRKYPELRKKAKNGGVYTLTTNKGSKLMMFPSTGDSQRIKSAKTAKFAYGGKRRKADTGTIITKDGTVLKTDTIVPPILGMVSPGEYIRRKYTPNITDLNSKPSGDNPAILMTTSDFNINANKDTEDRNTPDYRGNALYTNWSSNRSNPNSIRQPDFVPYTPYQWDDNKFVINRQTINRAATNRVLRGSLNNNGDYDPIEEGILQVRELGTGQSGTPEGFQWSGYADVAESNPNLNYQSDATNKRLKQWGFNPGIIERVGNINLNTPPVATPPTATSSVSVPINTTRPAVSPATLPRRGKTTALPTVSIPDIVKENIISDRGNTATDEAHRRLRLIPIPIIDSGAPVPSALVTSNSGLPSEKNKSKRNIGKEIVDWAKNNPDTVMDGLSLVSNVGLATAGFLQNRRFLDKMRYAPQPYARQAAKLKTRINIEPQLDKMRESLAEYERNVRNNTASSRVALARQQRARLKNIMDTNELYGTKENIETQLINKDRLNQQEVANSNIEEFNKWRQGRAEFMNTINEAKAENIASYINAINSGVQDVATRVQKRNSEKRTNRAMMLANPNLPAEMLLSSGLITQDMYDEYRKAYPLKKRK